MWTHYFCVYSATIIGVYCLVLPQEADGIPNRLKMSSSKQLDILSSRIVGKDDKGFSDLLTPLLKPRMPDTQNHLDVQQYIKDHFNKLNWDVEEDTFTDDTPYGRKQFNNIITTLEPQVKNKLVLSCHYDSKNMSNSKGDYFVAATDSAVPCAIMMDLAVKLECSLEHKQKNRKRSLKDDVTIQMIFFDGEEAYKDWTATDSLYGSRHLAQKWMNEPDQYDPGTSRMNNIELFVLLDLIGSSDVTFKKFQSGTDKHFQHLQKIEKNLKKMGLLNTKGPLQNKVLFSSARPWGGIEDDHKPFEHLRRDLPILHLISTPFPKVWHTMRDNKDAIDFEVTENFIKIFRVFVANYLGLSGVSCRK